MTNLVGSRSAQLKGHIGPHSIGIVPMGAITPHGPHLPLETTTLIADECARRTALELESKGVDCFVLPAVDFGIARLAQDFPGGITMRPGTMWALVEDLVLSLQQDGVRQLLLCNAHPEFEQVRVLRHLCVDYSARTDTDCQLLYPSGAPDFEPKFTEQDAFGGQLETSMMLAIAPQLVDWSMAQELEPVALNLPTAIHGKNRSILQIGAQAGYLGNPAAASAQAGEAFLQAWAQSLARGCADAWPDLF